MLEYQIGSNPIFLNLLSALLAQWIEQLPSKQLVAGSNPAWRTKSVSPDGGIGRRGGFKIHFRKE